MPYFYSYIVLLQHVRSTLQFVANPNRGCVAVSRAQEAVYLFGDWFSLVKTKFWSKFVDGIDKAGAMVRYFLPLTPAFQVDSKWQPSTDADYRKLRAAVTFETGRNRSNVGRERAGTNHSSRETGNRMNYGPTQNQNIGRTRKLH